jgi:hypothetical protein
MQHTLVIGGTSIGRRAAWLFLPCGHVWAIGRLVTHGFEMAAVLAPALDAALKWRGTDSMRTNGTFI